MQPVLTGRHCTTSPRGRCEPATTFAILQESPDDVVLPQLHVRCFIKLHGDWRPFLVDDTLTFHELTGVS